MNGQKFYRDKDSLALLQGKINKIFFYRVCGTGMGAAACLLKEAGYEVFGADRKYYPPMSTYLKSTGIGCIDMESITKEYLSGFDLIVVGNVVANGSEDAKLIESLEVPFSSFPAALGGLLLKDMNVVGIAGTHGKTTTTYFLSQILESLGKDPGYFVGGVIEGSPSAKLGDRSYFIIESDEYDSAYFEKFSKFHSYDIDHLILTSLEFDHADIFSSLEDIEKEFLGLDSLKSGSAICDTDYPSIKKFSQDYDFIPYGMKLGNSPKIEKEDESGSKFSINYKNEELSFSSNIVGEHNILNLTACILFCLKEGFLVADIQKSLQNLKMVKRRQEIRGSYRDSIVIDDFAHHPRAVALTIDGIKKKYPDKKLTIVFEPNSATARSDYFQTEFVEALSGGDSFLLVQPERKTTIRDMNNIDMDQISEKLENAFVCRELDQILEKIDSLASKDNIFLVLSNGTCLGLWESDFVQKLS